MCLNAMLQDVQSRSKYGRLLDARRILAGPSVAAVAANGAGASGPRYLLPGTKHAYAFTYTVKKT